MNQLHILVSHSSHDKIFTDALVEELERAGADVWYDEQNLGPGPILNIQRELVQHPVFIVVLSKDSMQSQWVRTECEWAWILYQRAPQRIILPLVISPIEPSDFDDGWIFLEPFKRVQGPQGQPYSYDEIIKRTLRLLDLTPHHGSLTPVMPHSQVVVEDEGLISLGQVLSAQGRYGEAAEQFEKAVQHEPGNPQAWLRLGWARYHMGRYQEALAAFDDALRIVPYEPPAWYGKAQCLEALGQTVEARKAHERGADQDLWQGPFPT